jgi:hypothetical protein
MTNRIFTIGRRISSGRPVRLCSVIYALLSNLPDAFCPSPANSAVHFLPVADSNHENAYCDILDLANDESIPLLPQPHRRNYSTPRAKNSLTNPTTGNT